MKNVDRTYSLWIGLDWADRKHDVCVYEPVSDTRSFKVISHSPEAIEEWLLSLQKKHRGQFAIALELSKGPIVSVLQKYEFVTIFPVHGLTLSKYRSAMYPSGAKDDPSDAELALDMMLNYPDKVISLKPTSDEVTKLSQLVEHRRLLVNEKRRYSNRLINALKQYYPQVLDWFSRRDSELFCDFVMRWPSLQAIKRARISTINKFFSSSSARACDHIDRHTTAIKNALPLTDNESIIQSHQLFAIAMCKQIKELIYSIREYEKEIKSLYGDMADASLFDSFPGVGVQLGPRLLAAFGEDRNRFSSALEMQNYAGLSPVTERSGNKSWVHWRWHCSTFIRQSFIEWAEKSVKYSYWAGLYYKQQRQNGKSHQAVVRSLAYKWVRIMYRCWKTKSPYDETKYLLALQKRNSPLLAVKNTG